MSYVYQSFSVGEVLLASKMEQISDNIRDHQHGVSSVSVLTREAGAGLTLLTSGTVSAAATLDIVLTSYTAYRGLLFSLGGFRPATDDVDFYMRWSTDGGATYATTLYNYANYGLTAAGTSHVQTSTAAGAIVLGGALTAVGAGHGVGNLATEGVNSQVTLLNQTSTAFWPRATFASGYVIASAVPSFQTGAVGRSAAQDVDAVRFLFSSGNITEGVYAVYGIN